MSTYITKAKDIASIMSQNIERTVGFYTSPVKTYLDTSAIYTKADIVNEKNEKFQEVMEDSMRSLLKRNPVTLFSSPKDLIEQIIEVQALYDKEEFEKAIEIWDRLNIRNIVNGYLQEKDSCFKTNYIHYAMTPSQLYASKRIAEIFEKNPFKSVSSKVANVHCIEVQDQKYYEISVDFTFYRNKEMFVEYRRYLDFNHFNTCFENMKDLIDETQKDKSFCKEWKDWISEVKKEVILPAKLLMNPLTEQNLKRIKAYKKRQELIENVEYGITHSRFEKILKYTDLLNERYKFLKEKYLPERFKT